MLEKQNKPEEKKKKPRKRKVGRPKKRGPKKKRKSRAKPKPDGRHNPKSKNTVDYKIVSCHNGKQDAYIGKYKTVAEAYEELERLKEESSKVVFPRLTENRRTGTSECMYEYLLLEKNRHGDKEGAVMRNEYGVLVTQETNSERWVVYDKLRYYVEETFWVYGYNPRDQRKTFTWILENLILPEGENDFVKVTIYRNKVLIKDDNGKLELVLCKTQGEAIRFYNKVSEMCKGNRNVIMFGSEESSRTRRKLAEDEIMELTGWTRYRVQEKKNRK